MDDWRQVPRDIDAVALRYTQDGVAWRVSCSIRCSLTAGYGLQYDRIIDPARQVTCLQPALSMSIVPRFRLRCAASTGAGCHYPARVQSEQRSRRFLQ